MNGGGFNGLCHKEFSKPPLSKKDKQKKQEEKKRVAEAKAAKRAQEEEEEAKVKADPAEREAELALAQEAEKKKSNDRRLQNVQKKAAKACSSNDWVHALALYTECIDIDANDHLHWSNRAAVQNKLGRFEEMLEDATKCIELNPEFAKGWARMGSANAALERYEAAEQAFQRALVLEPESKASLEGLDAAQKARKEIAQEDSFDTMLRELKMLTPIELQKRALEEGVHEDKIEETGSHEDVKEALVSLIVAHRYIVDLVHEDLAELDLEGLNARASEEGLDENAIAATADCDDPIVALQTLIVMFVANDLVGAATDMLEDAKFEEVSDDDIETLEEDMDLEIIALDDAADLELGINDVFLEGAYIDDKYGELVLPSGIRLGHRSMHKYYKQRLRSNDKQIVLSSARHKTMDLHSRVQAKIARQQGWKTDNRISSTASKASRNAFTSVAMRKRRTELHNMKIWHNLHMWGAGGGGSHYWCAGSKQYIKGNKMKGVVLRHSRQGAKLQSERNKSNRGNASFAVLR